MGIVKYRYAASAAQDVDGVVLGAEQRIAVDKELAGSPGILFRVVALYGAAATRGLSLQVVQGLVDGSTFDTPDSYIAAVEMPGAAGSMKMFTLPVMIPGTAPGIQLNLVNLSGDSATIFVSSRIIEGMEVV
jgi:hypothetical protein